MQPPPYDQPYQQQPPQYQPPQYQPPQHQPQQYQPSQYQPQPYPPPQQSQPAYDPHTGYPQHAPPAYAPPPSYLTLPPEAHQALLSKARRDIVFGAIWLAFGLFITLFTLARFGPYLIVAFGPIGYGIYKIIKGSLTLRRHG
jgi:hypothetical protein